MKLLTVALTICGIAYSQAKAGPHIFPAPGTHEPIVKMSVEDVKIAIVNGMLRSGNPKGSIQLHRWGDGASVNIMKAIATRPALSEIEELTVLEMVRISFERPEHIWNDFDRTPKAALFLLTSLDGSTQDPGIKQKIAETKQFVLAAVPR